MQLAALPFLSALVFNSVTASLNIDKQSGFDCGRVFFRRNVIRTAGSLVSQNLKRSSQISLVDGDSFLGGNPGHVGWPIRESGQIYGSGRTMESFYILIDSSGRVKDVMARLSNDDYAKCLWKDGRRKSSLLDTSNGYKCGQNFFGDEQLRGDLDEAISKLGKGLTYPSPYKGNLYTENEYFTWPILNDKKDNTSHWEQSPFHIILSRDGKIIDVVAKLKCNNFIKCQRATKLLRGRSEKTSLLQRRGVEQQYNYKCDFTVIYTYDKLRFARNLAQAKQPFEKDKTKPTVYPKIHKTFPCVSAPCLIWPIFPDGTSYVKGNPVGRHFLVMDMQFNIREVITITPNAAIACEKLSPSRKAPVASGPVGGNNRALSPPRNDRNEFKALPGGQPPWYRPP